MKTEQSNGLAQNNGNMETTKPVGHPQPPITYNPEELERIISVIRHCTDPEEIILFGNLAGGTQFSEVAAYDLFVVTESRPAKDWERIRRYLNLEIPPRSRTIEYINFYLCRKHEIYGSAAHMAPFYFFAQSEGQAVFCRRKFHPKLCDYEKLLFAAQDRYYLFFENAGYFLHTDTGGDCFVDLEIPAFFTACAVEFLLQALYVAYHGTVCELHSLSELYLRTRTISTELCIMLNPEQPHIRRMFTQLDKYRKLALYGKCHFDKEELDGYFDIAIKLETLIEKLSTDRLALYESRMNG